MTGSEGASRSRWVCRLDWVKAGGRGQQAHFRTLPLHSPDRPLRRHAGARQARWSIQRTHKAGVDDGGVSDVEVGMSKLDETSAEVTSAFRVDQTAAAETPSSRHELAIGSKVRELQLVVLCKTACDSRVILASIPAWREGERELTRSSSTRPSPPAKSL